MCVCEGGFTHLCTPGSVSGKVVAYIMCIDSSRLVISWTECNGHEVAEMTYPLARLSPTMPLQDETQLLFVGPFSRYSVIRLRLICTVVKVRPFTS